MPNVIYSRVPLIEREDLAIDSEAVYGVPFTELRTWDAMATNLPGTAANDDLALVTGTLGTDSPTIQAGDIGGTASTRYASFEFVLPPEYNSGGTVKIRASAGMDTSVADTSATLDFQAYRVARDGTVGSDLVTTAAQSINSTSFAEKEFSLTPTSLSAGDKLHVRMAIAYSDTGNLAVMIPAVGGLDFMLDIRG